MYVCTIEYHQSALTHESTPLLFILSERYGIKGTPPMIPNRRGGFSIQIAQNTVNLPPFNFKPSNTPEGGHFNGTLWYMYVCVCIHMYVCVCFGAHLL